MNGVNHFGRPFICRQGTVLEPCNEFIVHHHSDVTGQKVIEIKGFGHLFFLVVRGLRARDVL